MTDTRQRIIRTAIQAGVPAVIDMIAALTTELGNVTEWWAPLALAALTTISSVLHNRFRPVLSAVDYDEDDWDEDDEGDEE